MKKTLITLAIMLMASAIHAQTVLNIGIGKTSNGAGTAKISLTRTGKLMPYMRFVDENLDEVNTHGKASLVGTEHDEITAGLIYQMDDIAFFAGAGRYRETTIYNPLIKPCTTKRSDVTAEIGFNYRLFNWAWGNITIDATLNSYSGVSSILSLGVKICK